MASSALIKLPFTLIALARASLSSRRMMVSPLENLVPSKKVRSLPLNVPLTSASRSALFAAFRRPYTVNGKATVSSSASSTRTWSLMLSSLISSLVDMPPKVLETNNPTARIAIAMIAFLTHFIIFWIEIVGDLS